MAVPAAAPARRPGTLIEVRLIVATLPSTRPMASIGVLVPGAPDGTVTNGDAMLRLELSSSTDPICNLRYTVAMDAYLEPLAAALHALESMPSFLRLAAARLGDSLGKRPRCGAFSFLEHVAHLHAAELTFVALSVQNGGSLASAHLEDEEPASRTHDSSPVELFSAARHLTCRTLRRASAAPPIRRRDRHSRRGLTARELTALIRQHDEAHCYAIDRIR